MHVCLSVNKTVEMQENRPFAIESVSCRRKPSEASRRRGAAFFLFLQTILFCFVCGVRKRSPSARVGRGALRGRHCRAKCGGKFPLPPGLRAPVIRRRAVDLLLLAVDSAHAKTHTHTQSGRNRKSGGSQSNNGARSLCRGTMRKRQPFHQLGYGTAK